MKYAVYVVLVEDTEDEFLRVTEDVDSWDSVVRGVSYDEALEALKAAADAA